MVRFRRKGVPEWVIAREHGLAVTSSDLVDDDSDRSDVIRDRCLEPLPIVTLDYLKKEPKGDRAVGSALSVGRPPRSGRRPWPPSAEWWSRIRGERSGTDRTGY